MKYKPTDKCPECSCEFKTKYMIRVDHDPKKPKAKSHWEATSRRSIVGWLKLICNEFGKFEEIQIHNMTKQCSIHKKYWNQKNTKSK
jgi:hypothetical protein